MAVKRKAAAKRKAPAKPKAAAKPAAPKGAAKPPAASKQKTENVMRPFPIRFRDAKPIMIVERCTTDGKTYLARPRDQEKAPCIRLPAADCHRV